MTPGCASAYCRATAAVSSVDPSSTTISSHLVHVCATTDSIAPAMYAPRLYAGRITETSGSDEGIIIGSCRPHDVGRDVRAAKAPPRIASELLEQRQQRATLHDTTRPAVAVVDMPKQ